MRRIGRWNLNGVTRAVFLTRRFAIKVPRIDYGWPMFLRGLLANMQEAEVGTLGWPELCPIVWRVPGGFLNVMRRAQELTDEDWREVGQLGLWQEPGVLRMKCGKIIPVECKRDSFGVLEGRLVAVDYGS